MPSSSCTSCAGSRGAAVEGARQAARQAAAGASASASGRAQPNHGGSSAGQRQHLRPPAAASSRWAAARAGSRCGRPRSCQSGSAAPRAAAAPRRSRRGSCRAPRCGAGAGRRWRPRLRGRREGVRQGERGRRGWRVAVAQGVALRCAPSVNRPLGLLALKALPSRSLRWALPTRWHWWPSTMVGTSLLGSEGGMPTGLRAGRGRRGRSRGAYEVQCESDKCIGYCESDKCCRYSRGIEWLRRGTVRHSAAGAAPGERRGARHGFHPRRAGAVFGAVWEARWKGGSMEGRLDEVNTSPRGRSSKPPHAAGAACGDDG
jgi:hypothetical protein